MHANNRSLWPNIPEFLNGGGEMGALMRAHDWAASPLGTPQSWPQPLKTITSVMLTANQPMFIAWGAGRTLLYNDAYSEILGDKHPSALGHDFLDVWSEIRTDLVPIVERAYAGEPLHMDDIELLMERRGYPEETHFAFSYTPVRDESGTVAGFFCPCVEITDQVLAERRRAADAERQQRLFEQAPGFITILSGPDHVFEFANAAYKRIFGDRDFVGRTVREAFPELEGQGFFELLDRVYVSGERFIADHIAVRLTPSPGQPLEDRFLDFIYEPVVDEEGRVTGIFVEGYDVTDAHRAEAELHESAARLSFLDRLNAETAPLADADAVLATTTRLLGEHLNLSVCAYADMDEDQDGFTIRGDWAAPGSTSIVGHYSLADFGELAVKNLTAGLPLVVNDNLRELAPEEAATFQSIGIAATICMPLVKEGRLTALMAIHDRVPRRWSDADLTLLREVTARSWSHVERVAALAELRASEARYRTLFETVEAGFSVVELSFDDDDRPIDYRFVEANPAFERQTGLKDAVGRTARELVPNLESHWFDLYGHVALTGEPVRFEQGSDAMGRWFDVHALRVGDPESRRVAILFNDISDRRAAEKRLHELNETLEHRIAEALAERKLLADLVETTDAFVQVADLDFRWLAINKAAADEFERIYGLRPKVGDSMLDALAHLPDHQAAVRAVWSRALAGEAYTEIGEFGDSGSERRSYEMKYHVLHDADGERIGAYQFAYDVTDRVREQQRLADAEAARREADALYRAYFQNTPEALFVIGVTPDGGFVVEQVNPAHEAGVGFRLEDVQGKRMEEVLPPDMAEPILATYRHVIETGAIYQYREVFGLHGEQQHWDTSLVPVRDADGPIRRLIGSSRNVTRQVLAEEALRQSQKMEAMGQLTGGVAHDFNNLLTPIVGSLDMLQRKQLGGEREQRLIAGAMQSAERAKTLVQRLLAFARRQPLQSVPVDIARLVTGMGDLVASTTGPQIKVIVEAADDLPPALADPNQLEMALLNLAVNARDAMSEGGTLRISASADRIGANQPPDLRAGHYIRLSVADTGAGMDEATLARAVEPFFSTKGVGKGTGLGLSMVHGLASQLGGALTIHSRPGLGTNVELWLPESAALPQPEEPVAEPSLTEAERGTALLVDDEELVRLSTADMLNDLGYRVVEAASAEEAMSLIEGGERFDILVTDHLMPGMNGADLARAARTARPQMPVLLVSGYAEGEGIAADLPRLTKPFRKDELASSLVQLLALS